MNANTLIAHLQLSIEKLWRELYCVRSERKARLLDQIEIELAELEADGAEDEFVVLCTESLGRTDHGSRLLEPRGASFSCWRTLPSTRATRPSESRARSALDAVMRINAIFDVEREINGFFADRRLAVHRKRVAPLVVDLEGWMRSERARLSRRSNIAKAINFCSSAERPLPAFLMMAA